MSVLNLLTDELTRERLDSLVDSVESSRDLAFVDTYRSALRSDCNHVLVASHLPVIMRVMHDCYPRSLLHPRDITIGNLKSIVSGVNVFSPFLADDFELASTSYIAIAAMAHGRTQEAAARQAGLSPRTLRRHLAPLLKAARVDDSFSWRILSPIFPV